MTANFAGSRNLDARRRRRLATEAEEAPCGDAIDSPQLEHDLINSRDEEIAGTYFPLRRIVPAKLWKAWGLSLTVIALAAGVLAAEHYSTELTGKLGPGVEALFGASPSGIAAYYTGLMWLLAGQLALLIRWVRSQNPQDFEGHYRLWLWAPAAFFTMSFCSLTGAHHAVVESAAWAWGQDLPVRAELGWLVPTALVGTMFGWKLMRDMGRCRSSLSLLVLAGGTLTASGVQVFLESPTWHPLLDSGLLMGAPLCVFGSMLLHARFVLHESSAPPVTRKPAKQEQKRKLFSWRLPKLQLRRSKSDAAPAADDKKPAERPARKTRAKTTTAKQSQTTSRSSNVEEPAEEIQLPQNGDQKLRVDRPDPNSLKGLSKRERRMARKKFREEQRSAGN